MGAARSRSALLYVLTTVLLVGTLALAAVGFAQFRAAARLVERTVLVESAISDVLATMLNAETGERGYVITGRSEYLEPYEVGAARATDAVARLRRLLVNPVQQVRLDDVEQLVARRLSEIRGRIDARDRGGLPAARTLIETGEGERTMDALRTELATMSEVEDRYLVERRGAQARDGAFTLGALTVTSALFGVLVLLGVASRRAAVQRARMAELQERFVAILGHDLRNPLSAMLANAQLLQRHAAPAQEPTLQRIVASGRRMGRMIEQLLDLARSRLGGGIPIAPARVDLGKVIDDVAEELGAAHPPGALAVEAHGAVVGCWDADRLAQVASNLVGNALDYRAAGTPVRVSVSTTARQAVLQVHNDGPPIPPALVPVLFNPFRRGERGDRSANTAGLGLGLFITHEVVAAHAGTIEVRSDEASGTTFTVRLPL